MSWFRYQGTLPWGWLSWWHQLGPQRPWLMTPIQMWVCEPTHISLNPNSQPLLPSPFPALHFYPLFPRAWLFWQCRNIQLKFLFFRYIPISVHFFQIPVFNLNDIPFVANQKYIHVSASPVIFTLRPENTYLANKKASTCLPVCGRPHSPISFCTPLSAE